MSSRRALVACIPRPAFIADTVAVRPTPAVLVAAVGLACNVAKVPEVPGHTRVTVLTRKRGSATTCAVSEAVPSPVTSRGSRARQLALVRKDLRGADVAARAAPSVIAIAGRVAQASAVGRASSPEVT